MVGQVHLQRRDGDRALGHRMDVEFANLRAAMTWAIEVKHAEIAHRISAGLDYYWMHGNLFREGRGWAERVLAIDASAHESRAPAGAEWFRAIDLRKRALTEPDAQSANLTLHPDFGYYVNLSREFRQRAIAAGYRTTMAAAAQLAVLHAST